MNLGSNNQQYNVQEILTVGQKDKINVLYYYFIL